MGRIVKLVALNERGAHIGENHHNARLTDGDVELMRTLHETEGWGYWRLAHKFDVSKRTAKLICQYRARCQTPMAFKVVGYMVDDDCGESEA